MANNSAPTITNEQVEDKATKMRVMTSAIMAAIAQCAETGAESEDMVVIMGSIGAVLGAIALASGRPEQYLAATVGIARSFIEKGLLDSDE